MGEFVRGQRHGFGKLLMPNSVITVNSSTTSIPILLRLNTCNTDGDIDSSSNIYFDYFYIMFNLGGIKLVRLFLKKFLEVLLFAAAAFYSIFKYFTFTNPNTHTVYYYCCCFQLHFF